MKSEENIKKIEQNLEELRICNEKLKEFKKIMDVIERSEIKDGKED